MKLKYVLLIVCFLFQTFTVVLAQEEEEEDQPVRKRQSGLVGGGGGVTPAWFLLKTDEINKSLALGNLPQLSNSGMFIMGGGGFFYVGFIPNLRFGGIGAGGSMEETQTQNGIFKSTKLSISYGGGSIEYVLPFGDFHIAAGILLGGGSSELTLTKSPTASLDWNNLFPQFSDGASTNSTRHQLTSSFFTYQPMLSAEYVPIPFVTIRLSGGYFGMSAGDWSMDEEFKITNAPDLKLQSPFIQLGVFFGAFLGR